MPDFPKKDTGRRLVSLEDANSGRRNPKYNPSADMSKELQRQDRADVQKAEQNIAPARIVEPRCDTCNHPYRDFIETMLIKGHAYKAIATRVSPPLDRRSVSNHYKNHMDLQDAALRSILEDEAKIQNRNFEEGVQDAITKRGVLEIALRKGYEDIVNGVTTVEARDLIQIAKVLGDMDSQQNAVGLDEARSQVMLFIQAIKDVCDPEMQAAIAQRVKQLRGREGIDAEFETMVTSPVAIPEASVVEDDEE